MINGIRRMEKREKKEEWMEERLEVGYCFNVWLYKKRRYKLFRVVWCVEMGSQGSLIS